MNRVRIAGVSGLGLQAGWGQGWGSVRIIYKVRPIDRLGVRVMTALALGLGRARLRA